MYSKVHTPPRMMAYGGESDPTVLTPKGLHEWWLSGLIGVTVLTPKPRHEWWLIGPMMLTVAHG